MPSQLVCCAATRMCDCFVVSTFGTCILRMHHELQTTRSAATLVTTALDAESHLLCGALILYQCGTIVFAPVVCSHVQTAWWEVAICLSLTQLNLNCFEFAASHSTRSTLHFSLRTRVGSSVAMLRSLPRCHQHGSRLHWQVRAAHARNPWQYSDARSCLA